MLCIRATLDIVLFSCYAQQPCPRVNPNKSNLRAIHTALGRGRRKPPLGEALDIAECKPKNAKTQGSSRT